MNVEYKIVNTRKDQPWVRKKDLKEDFFQILFIYKSFDDVVDLPSSRRTIWQYLSENMYGSFINVSSA